MMLDEVYNDDAAERLNKEIIELETELHRKKQELANIKNLN